MEDEFNKGTIIKVIGVGGGGGNAVLHMVEAGVQGVEFINANTDSQALVKIPTHRTLKLGKSGLGAGSKPEKGREAALEAEQEIREILDGAHMLFITAGMGGGTGTGAAPVIAQIAKDMGILTVGVVTKPFEWEGFKRMKNAEDGLKELEKSVDSLIIVLNENLLKVYGEDITQEEAFACANNILKNAVGGISEIINEYGQINVDFEDIKTVMSEPGRSMMGTAVARGPERARIAAEEAITCPLLEGVDLACAKGVLVLVSASRGSLKLTESKVVMNTVNQYASQESHIIYGAAYDDTLGDDIRVTVVATGLSKLKDAKELQAMAQEQAQIALQPESDMLSLKQFTRMTLDNPGVKREPTLQPKISDVPTVAVSHGWRAPKETVKKLMPMNIGNDDNELEIPAFLRKQTQE